MHRRKPRTSWRFLNLLAAAAAFGTTSSASLAQRTEASATPTEQQEPPLVYEISIDGVAYRLKSGRHSSLRIDGQLSKIHLEVANWRKLDIGDFSFDFPASHEVSRTKYGKTTIYHVASKYTSIVINQSPPGLLRVRDIAASGDLSDYRRLKIEAVLTEETITLGDHRYDAKIVTAARGLARPDRPEYKAHLQIATKKHTYLITIIDEMLAKDKHSDEYKKVIEGLKTSFRLVSNK